MNNCNPCNTIFKLAEWASALNKIIVFIVLVGFVYLIYQAKNQIQNFSWEQEKKIIKGHMDDLNRYIKTNMTDVTNVANKYADESKAWRNELDKHAKEASRVSQDLGNKLDKHATTAAEHSRKWNEVANRTNSNIEGARRSIDSIDSILKPKSILPNSVRSSMSFLR